MQLSQALDAIAHTSPDTFASLSEILNPELIEQCLHETGTVTLRKRRLPMEMMVWGVVGVLSQRSRLPDSLTPFY